MHSCRGVELWSAPTLVLFPAEKGESLESGLDAGFCSTQTNTKLRRPLDIFLTATLSNHVPFLTQNNLYIHIHTYIHNTYIDSYISLCGCFHVFMVQNHPGTIHELDDGRPCTQGFCPHTQRKSAGYACSMLGAHRRSLAECKGARRHGAVQAPWKHPASKIVP